MTTKQRAALRSMANTMEPILHIGKDVFFGTRDEYLESPAGRFFVLQKEEEERNG